MGIYSNAGLLVDQVRAALTRGEPLLELTPDLFRGAIGALLRADQLMARAETTLGNSDRVLLRIESLLGAAERLLALEVANAELELKKKGLEIESLESARPG